MSEYDNRGQIALWGKKEDAGPNAPAAKGHFFAHRDIKEGEQIEVALWKNESDNPNAPLMKGKVSDKFTPGEPVQSPAQEPLADDVPFS